MFKIFKQTLPIAVFIMLGAGSIGLWLRSTEIAILIGGLGSALMAALLFYAVIKWDEAFERKKMETQQLANVVNHTTDAVVIASDDGLIRYANESALSAYHLPEFQPGRYALEHIGLTTELAAAVVAQVLNGKPWSGELRHEAAGGAPQVHLTSIFRIEQFRQHAPAVVSIGRDLTQSKELECKLRHSQKLAAVGELASGVAHEINNPMAAIQSQIGLAKDYVTRQNGAAPNGRHHILACIDEADRQIKRCSKIVDSLLRFSRRPETHKSAVKIEDAVKMAIEFVSSLARMKDVKFVQQPCGNLPRVASDCNSVSQIVANLLINAADAMGHRGEVRVALRQTVKHVSLEVLDDGCGIPREDLERVFEPFFTTKPPGMGTGLGLSISYGIAESLGAELSLASRPGGGTCATLKLPLGSE